MNKCINTEDELLDRDFEIKKLSDIIKNKSNQNTIIIVTGISGIGKSGLVAKLKKSNIISDEVLTVKMSKHSLSTIENLQYFNAIYKSFQDFSFKNNSLVLTPVQYGYSSIGNFIKYIFSLLKSKKGYGDAISISEDESIIRKKDYITYAINNSNIILNIENFQNIDTQSFEILKEIIANSNKKTFIFEYTLHENEQQHYINMYKELLETNAQIKDFRVEKMDFYYAKQLAPKNTNLDFSILEQKYNLSNGNLMEIILASDSNTIEKSNINISLNDLTSYEKYLVYIVYLNDSSIDYNLLCYISLYINKKDNLLINEISEKNIDNVINILFNKKIFGNNKEIIFIKHDSIRHELDKIHYDPILYCAYSNVKKYYFDELKKNNSNAEIIEKLLALLLKFSDDELFSILPNIKNLIQELKYPKLIIHELEKFRKTLVNASAVNQKGIYSLTIFLVEICLSNKLYIEAQNNLNIIFDSRNDYHIALQGEIYALQESTEIEEKISKLIYQAKEGSRLKLILELCMMYYSMKKYNTSKSKNYGEKILNNQAYIQYKEYGYVLRNYAELCESSDESIQYYNDAIKTFEKNNMNFDIACVHISLSMIYAYKGDLKSAKDHIKKAMILDHKNLSKCYILNNSSVIDILNNNYNEKTEKDLRDSLLLSVSQYEKIIVYCNLLVYYCLTENRIKAIEYADKIESSDYQNFKYEEFLHIVYQNLLFFYSKQNDSSKENYYYKKIIEIIGNPNTSKSTKDLAKAMNGLSEKNSFYSRFPFRVDFLGYWEFSIDNDLDHSE